MVPAHAACSHEKAPDFQGDDVALPLEELLLLDRRDELGLGAHEGVQSAAQSAHQAVDHPHDVRGALAFGEVLGEDQEQCLDERFTEYLGEPFGELTLPLKGGDHL